MSRTTSTLFRNAINAPETGEAFIFLLTIDHSTLSSPFRFCSNGIDMTSRGETYYAYPFQIRLPQDNTDRIPTITLVIDNIHRDIVSTIRTITTPPTVTVEVVLESTPDTIEALFPEFILRNTTYNRITIEGTLQVELLEAEPFPGESYNTVNFPGLF